MPSPPQRKKWQNREKSCIHFISHYGLKLYPLCPQLLRCFQNFLQNISLPGPTGEHDMAAPPGQFIALQAINTLKETISG